MCFENGLLHHGVLAKTMLAFIVLARAKMKSNGRDKAIEYVKKTGQYKQELRFVG